MNTQTFEMRFPANYGVIRTENGEIYLSVEMSQTSVRHYLAELFLNEKIQAIAEELLEDGEE